MSYPLVFNPWHITNLFMLNLIQILLNRFDEFSIMYNIVYEELAMTRISCPEPGLCGLASPVLPIISSWARPGAKPWRAPDPDQPRRAYQAQPELLHGALASQSPAGHMSQLGFLGDQQTQAMGGSGRRP